MNSKDNEVNKVAFKTKQKKKKHFKKKTVVLHKYT